MRAWGYVVWQPHSLCSHLCVCLSPLYVCASSLYIKLCLSSSHMCVVIISMCHNQISNMWVTIKCLCHFCVYVSFLYVLVSSSCLYVPFICVLVSSLSFWFTYPRYICFTCPGICATVMWMYQYYNKNYRYMCYCATVLSVCCRHMSTY